MNNAEKNGCARLRVTSFVTDENRYLLIKENIKSMGNQPYWLPPGGGVEYMESLEQAAVREAKEETNLDVRVQKFITFVEVIEPENSLHTINFVYLVEPVSKEIKKEDGALEIGWYTKEEALKLNLTELVRDVLTNNL